MPSKKVASYKKNFLDRVILRCDYDFAELGKLEEFSKTLKGIFPFQEAKDDINREMTIDFAKGEVLSNRGEQLKRWVFLSPDRKKNLIITPIFAALEYTNNSYRDKAELIDDFKQALLPYLHFFEINTVNRVGLRYINNINLNSVKGQLDWGEYLHKDLLGGVAVNKKLKNDLARSMTTLEMKHDTANIRFTYGIWNKDYPNENTRKEFILDIDCYSKFPHDADEDIVEVIKNYNNIAENIFEKTIKENLRNVLRKQIS